MRKLTAVFLIIALLLLSVPLFAAEEEAKAHPSSPFNIVNEWFTSLGERADGSPVWEFKTDEKSSLTAEEIIERRGKIGAGMRGSME